MKSKSLFTDDTVPPDGLAAEYRLDQGAGASAPDSVNGNDGTNFGAQRAQES